MKRGGLGRGLDVLLPQNGELLETVVRDISIDEIDRRYNEYKKASLRVDDDAADKIK